MKLSEIKVSNFNVREIINEESIKQLKESINKFNLLSKIILRKKGDQFEIIAGQRRYKALLSLKGPDYELSESDYVVRDDLDDFNALLLSIDENQQRTDLSPIELNKAALRINKLDSSISTNKIAQILNITPYRLKRILHLSEDSGRIPPEAAEELKKPTETSKFNDAHWEKIRSSNILDNPEAIKDVVNYVMEKDSPPRELPSIIKAVDKAHKGPIIDDGDQTDISLRGDDEGSSGPIEYAHKGQLVLIENGDGKTLKVIGKRENEEVPVEHYMEYLKNPDKFKCYVTFKLKIKPILD